MRKATELSSRSLIRNETDVHQAVMHAYSLLNQQTVSTATMTEVATIVSELAMNITKFATRGGSILFNLQLESPAFVEIIAQDQGPGIADINLALSDHYSSSGTLGVGLPGVKRMSDEFTMKSEPGQGTQVTVRKYLSLSNSFAPRARPAESAPASASANTATSNKPETSLLARINRPCYGEAVSGDLCYYQQNGANQFLALIDVLGHGQEAYQLACRCQSWLVQHNKPDLISVISDLHQEIRGSRGIAMTLACLHGNQLELAGVGNTIMYLVNDQVQLFSAQPGVIGCNLPRLQTTRLHLHDGDILIFTSDGISEHIDSQQFLARKHFPLKRLVMSLLNDFGKIYDDASCMALRYVA